MVPPYNHEFEPFLSYALAVLCFTPLMLHRNAYTVLLLHVVASGAVLFAVIHLSLRRLSDAMTAPDPKARPTAAECLQYVRFNRGVTVCMFLGMPVLLLLYPFDAYGSLGAERLTSLLLLVMMYGSVGLLAATPLTAINCFKKMSLLIKAETWLSRQH